MTLLHQAAQKAVEALNAVRGDKSFCCLKEERTQAVVLAAIAQLSAALQHQEVPREPVARSSLPDPLGCRACTHPDCGRYDGPRRVECRAMCDNACARPPRPLAASPSTTRQQEVGIGFWWCARCQCEVPSRSVTYEETHDVRAGGCGHPVGDIPAAPSTPEKAGGGSEPAFVDWEGRPYDEQGEPLFTEPSPIPHPLPAQANDGGEHG